MACDQTLWSRDNDIYFIRFKFHKLGRLVKWMGLCTSIAYGAWDSCRKHIVYLNIKRPILYENVVGMNVSRVQWKLDNNGHCSALANLDSCKVSEASCNDSRPLQIV